MWTMRCTLKIYIQSSDHIQASMYALDISKILLSILIIMLLRGLCIITGFDDTMPFTTDPKCAII